MVIYSLVKQLFIVVLQNRCLYKFCKILKETAAPETFLASIYIQYLGSGSFYDIALVLPI